MSHEAGCLLILLGIGIPLLLLLVFLVVGWIVHHNIKKKSRATDNFKYCAACEWCLDPRSVAPVCRRFRDPITGHCRYCFEVRTEWGMCGLSGKYWEVRKDEA